MYHHTWLLVLFSGPHCDVVPKKIFLSNHDCKDFLILLPGKITVLGFTFRLVISFELIFVYGVPLSIF
jgi:hypothetical protein